MVDVESLQVCVNLKQITMSARRRMMMALRMPMMMVELISILLMLNCFISVTVCGGGQVRLTLLQDPSARQEEIVVDEGSASCRLNMISTE